MTELAHPTTANANVEYETSSSDDEYARDTDIHKWLERKANQLFLQRQPVRKLNTGIATVAAVKPEPSDNDSKQMDTDDVAQYTVLAQYAADTITPDIQCAICREAITQCVVLLSCMHRYCHQCIARSLRNDWKRCPVCNVELKSKRDWRADTRYDSIVAILSEHNPEYSSAYRNVAAPPPVAKPATVYSAKYYLINIKSMDTHNKQIHDATHSLLRITISRQCNITVNQLCALIDKQLKNSKQSIVLYLEYNNVLLELCEWMEMRWLITEVLQWTEQTYIVKARNSKFKPTVTLVYELQPA